jgi:hypothetical protein
MTASVEVAGCLRGATEQGYASTVMSVVRLEPPDDATVAPSVAPEAPGQELRLAAAIKAQRVGPSLCRWNAKLAGVPKLVFLISSATPA